MLHRLPVISRLIKTVIFCSLTFISSQTFASSAGFALSNDMIDLQWQADLGSNISGGLSLLHADVDSQKTDVISGNFFLNNQQGSIEFRMGGKLYYLQGKYAKKNKVEAHGLLLGGDFTYNITEMFFVDIGAFYSPNIINGGDFENYLEAHSSFGIKPSNNAKLFIGYKHTEASIGKFDYEPYQGIMLGFTAEF